MAILFFFVSVVGCGDDDGGGGDVDSGTGTTDGGTDAGPGEMDAGTDAGGDMDAGADAGDDTDAGSDAGADTDAGTDAGVEAVTPSAAGDLVITEIVHSPAGYSGDELAEWIEIYNPSTTVTYELMGCDVADREERLFDAAEAHTIASSVIVGPGEYVVIASNDDATALGFTPEYSHADTFGLSGDGEDPAIGCDSTVIDVVDYAPAGGFPAGVDGQALSLDPGSLDATANDTGSNWCNNSTDLFHTEAGSENYGTPGAENPSCT